MNRMRVHPPAGCGQATIAAARLASAYEIDLLVTGSGRRPSQKARCRRSLEVALARRA